MADLGLCLLLTFLAAGIALDALRDLAGGAAPRWRRWLRSTWRDDRP